MNHIIKPLLTGVLLLLSFIGQAQSPMKWPDGKLSLIVLTYDDALDSQLDVAIPQLDKANLKGTFFLKEPSTEQQLSRWKTVAQNGHELANHTVYHPCLSSKFPADAHYQAENYSVNNIIREIQVMNKMIYSMDNKKKHTYAYPCCETSVGGKRYVDSLRKCGIVTYARSCGADPLITDFKKLDPYEVPCMGYSNNPSASEMIEFAKKVQQSKGMGVFMFHGVGGDYLEVSSGAHQQLLQYLKDNKDIWVTTFQEAMDYVTKNLK